LSSYPRSIDCRHATGRAGARVVNPSQLPLVLHDVAAVIGLCINEVAAAGFMETAALLAIAQLDLKARLNGLSEAELSALASLSSARYESADARSKLD